MSGCSLQTWEGSNYGVCAMVLGGTLRRHMNLWCCSDLESSARARSGCHGEPQETNCAGVLPMLLDDVHHWPGGVCMEGLRSGLGSGVSGNDPDRRLPTSAQEVQDQVHPLLPATTGEKGKREAKTMNALFFLYVVVVYPVTIVGIVFMGGWKVLVNIGDIGASVLLVSLPTLLVTILVWGKYSWEYAASYIGAVVALTVIAHFAGRGWREKHNFPALSNDKRGDRE